MINSCKYRTVAALSVLRLLKQKDNLLRLTTTIKPEKLEDYSADIVTIESSDGTVIATCYVVYPNT